MERLLFDENNRVIYTTGDIARILGIRSAEALRLLKEGEIPSFKWTVNGKWVNVALADDVKAYKAVLAP